MNSSLVIFLGHYSSAVYLSAYEWIKTFVWCTLLGQKLLFWKKLRELSVDFWKLFSKTESLGTCAHGNK